MPRLPERSDIGPLLSRVLAPWRHSLQVRVVATAIILGALAVSTVGLYLYERIADGLTDDRVRTAQAEAASVTADVEEDLIYDDRTGDLEGFGAAAQNVVGRILVENSRADRYAVMLPSLLNETDAQLGPVVQGVTGSPVPLTLRQALADDPSRQQTTMIELDRAELSDDPLAAAWTADVIPAMVVGQQIQVTSYGPYDVFLIYPMDREKAMLDLIRPVFAIAAAILLALLAGISWLVARQVVTPVRRAAVVAERFATGDLGERMRTGGPDDLAVLAQSFNGMADSIQTQIRQLEDLSRVQQVFVSDVSHELRTPLTTIRMAADVLHDGRAAMPPALGRSAELLSTELDRFEDLLTDLLEISRFDAGAAVLDLERVDLTALTHRVVAGVQMLADHRGSPVRIVAPLGPVVAECDPRRVERIVRNLVVNAIEHGEGKPIDVHIAANETAAAVAVKDHGVGLRPGESSMVFIRFWRADPARARTTGGTGLGLAISLEDARLHDGWLQAWGEPGRGSTFRLTLPLVASEPIGESPVPLLPEEAREETTRLRPVRPVTTP